MRATIVIRVLSLILTCYFAFDATMHVAEEIVVLELETEKDAESKEESKEEIDKQTEKHIFLFKSSTLFHEFTLLHSGSFWLNPTIEISDPPPESSQFI